MYQIGRPAIVEREELTGLAHAISTIMGALVKLPTILGDGDIRRFWGLLGYEKAKQALISIGHRGDMLGQIGRCGLLRDATGFEILEVNASSAMGALDSRVLMDSYLRDWRYADYVAELGLTFMDPANSTTQWGHSLAC